MARQHDKTRYSDTSGVREANWVCKKCLEDNPKNKSLLWTTCLDRGGHKRFPQARVWWWAERSHLELYDHRIPGRIPEVRQIPFSNFDDGKPARLCDPSRCWGYKCRFAHSVEEREIWNARNLKPKDTRSK